MLFLTHHSLLFKSSTKESFNGLIEVWIFISQVSEPFLEFGKNRAVTRKKKQTDYEKLYTGPAFALDTRYVQVFYFLKNPLTLKM